MWVQVPSQPLLLSQAVRRKLFWNMECHCHSRMYPKDAEAEKSCPELKAIICIIFLHFSGKKEKQISLALVIKYNCITNSSNQLICSQDCVLFSGFSRYPKALGNSTYRLSNLHQYTESLKLPGAGIQVGYF